MKLRFHGALAQLYGPSFEIQADNVYEAIEGFFRQQPDHPRDMVIDVIDFDTVDKMKAKTRRKSVDLVPSMFGGGGKFGSILIGAALIGLSFIPGVGQVLGATLTTALLTTGIAMVLQGVMGLFMKAPTLSKAEDPPPSKYFGVDRNTATQGTPITLATGRIKLFPHWLSLQSDADKMSFGVFPANPT